MMNSQKPILLVEDDSIDAMMVKRALKELKVTNGLIHRENGEMALNFLKNDAFEKPCLILLDLNMPRMNGLEFLEVIKNDTQLKSIPVIILTTSSDHYDLIASYNYSVAGYMVKPVDYHEFVDKMKTISKYWSNSELPF